MLSTSAATRKDRNTAASSPTFQHRHFSTIAAIIAEMTMPRRLTVAREFADGLRHTNPNFDRARFMRACGVSD